MVHLDHCGGMLGDVDRGVGELGARGGVSDGGANVGVCGQGTSPAFDAGLQQRQHLPSLYHPSPFVY